MRFAVKYSKVKSTLHGEKIALLYPVGSFYEVVGAEAVEVGELIGLPVLYRNFLESLETEPICGIVYHQLPRVVGVLCEAGFTVAIAEESEEGGFTKVSLRIHSIKKAEVRL